ncbi:MULTISPECIES: c-type cytochrome [Marinomonas]|uniref:Cytochrome c5 family protein n=1 Tax=Marinomonas rhodophyticola TaxID=2992803 RepID=A0ABT3KK48_9GAMM|nr:cytochrome c5 family protein [Marinomonas sp. KJ51-3]MCW4630924.1 cytochrome c5 family protein [Marinomonas sp. KJ51-3]
MFFIRLLRSYRPLALSFGVCLLALLPAHGQASEETNTTAQPYSGRPVTQIYNTYCIACHVNGVAGAPRIGHAEEWQPRIEKGIDTLLKNATNGFKAMPPKGLCFDCSEDELRGAIQYMIDNSPSN